MSLEQQIFMLLNLGRRESAYGTEIDPRATWYQVNGPGLLSSGPSGADTDTEEVNGTQYEKSSTVTEKSSNGNISCKLNPELFGYFLTVMMANVSTAGSYIHTITAPPAATKSPYSFGATQAQDRDVTATYKGYDGLVVNSMEFTIEADSPIITCSADILGDGSETDKSAEAAPSLPGITVGTQLLRKDLTLSLGASGVTNILTSFRKATFRINANLNQVRTVASAEKSGEVFYPDGPIPSVEVDLTLKGKRGGTFHNYFTGQTVLDIDLQLIDTDDAAKFIKFRGHQCHFEPIAKDICTRDETGAILEFPKLIFQYDTAESTPWTWTIGNAITAYAAAS